MLTFAFFRTILNNWILGKAVSICFCIILSGHLSLAFDYEGGITGKVTDEQQNTLPGVNIVIQGTGKGAITDVKGEYFINNLDKGTYVLEVSFVGFEKIVKSFSIKDGQTIKFDFSLKQSTQELAEVIVQGKSESQLKEEQPIQVESIRLKTVANQIKDLSGALLTLPGVRVQSSGSLGDRADISLNGLTGQAVRTYIDGLPFEFLYPSLYINNIPLVNIRRLDVYKGVVPVDVGTDAMAGAINVVPDYRNRNFLDAFYSYGSFNTHQLGVNSGFALNEKAILQVNTAYNYSDNNYEIDAEIVDQQTGRTRSIRAERFHDAYELKYVDLSLILLGNRVFDFVKVGLNYSDYFKEVNNNVTIGRIPWGKYEYDGNIGVVNLSLEKQVGSALEIRSQFAYSHSTLNTVDTTSRVYSWDGSIVQENDERGEFQDNPVLSERNNDNFINRTTLKYQLSENDEVLLSNVYAYQDIFGRDLEKEPVNDLLTFPQSIRKNVTGLQYTRKVGKYTFNAAGKFYDYALEGVDLRNFSVSEKDNDLGFYGAFKYDIKDNLFIRTSYEKGIRIPNAGEFFGNGTTITPNGGLEPEKSDNVNLEFGISSKDGVSIPWGIEINGFYRDQENLIQLSAAEVLPKYLNQQGVRTVGVETEFFIEIFKGLRYNGNLTGLSQTITALNVGSSNDDLIGTPNPNTPDFLVFNELAYTNQGIIRSDDEYRVYFQYYYVETFNHIQVGSVFNPDNWVPTQHRVNAGISYALMDGKFSIAANVFNLLNNDLFDNFNVPRPGRNYNVRLGYRLNNF